MNIHEYQGKQVLKQYGVAVPEGHVAFSPEEAVKAVTINFAEIFNLDSDYGSLTVGKQANLFICDGDPFETKTTIEQVFINGYKIPMQSRHSQLYDEFLERYPASK